MYPKNNNCNRTLLFIITLAIILYFIYVMYASREHFTNDIINDSEYIILYNGSNFYVYRDKLLLFINNDFTYITQYFRNLNVKFPPLINTTDIKCLKKKNGLILNDTLEYICSRKVAKQEYDADKKDFYTSPLASIQSKKTIQEYNKEANESLLNCMFSIKEKLNL